LSATVVSRYGTLTVSRTLLAGPLKAMPGPADLLGLHAPKAADDYLSPSTTLSLSRPFWLAAAKCKPKCCMHRLTDRKGKGDLTLRHSSSEAILNACIKRYENLTEKHVDKTTVKHTTPRSQGRQDKEVPSPMWTASCSFSLFGRGIERVGQRGESGQSTGGSLGKHR
jgi:hypothetical protein